MNAGRNCRWWEWPLVGEGRCFPTFTAPVLLVTMLEDYARSQNYMVALREMSLTGNELRSGISGPVDVRAKNGKRTEDEQRFKELWEGVGTPSVLSSFLVMVALGLFFWSAPLSVVLFSVVAPSVVFFPVYLLRHRLPVSFGMRRTEIRDGFVIESSGAWMVLSAFLLVAGVMVIRAAEIDADPNLFVVVIGWFMVGFSFISVGGARLQVRGRWIWFAYSWHTRRVLELSEYTRFQHRSTGKGGMVLTIEGPKKKDDAPDRTRMYSKAFGVFGRRGSIAVSDVVFPGLDRYQLEQQIKESAGLSDRRGETTD